MRYSKFSAVLLVLLATVPVSAQERDISRRLFTYLDTRVTVEVMADAPGTLRIVRGEAGLIDVAARVPGGVSAFALGGRSGDNLRLTAVGGEHADFIVVVPEDVHLRVRLPNSQATEVGSTRPGGTFSWPAGATNGTTNGASSGVALAGTHGSYTNGSAVRPQLQPGGVAVAHSAARAPRTLNVSKLTTARTITLRVEPGMFEVGGNRPMTVVAGSRDNVEVRTGDQSEDVVISIPSDTRDFTFKVGGRTALVIRGAEITTYCDPVTEQVLGGDRRWYTFAPEAGRLTCR